MFNVFVIDSFTSSDNKNVELLPFQKCPVIDPLTKTLRSRSLFIDHLLAPQLFSEPINYIPPHIHKWSINSRIKIDKKETIKLSGVIKSCEKS